MKSNFLVHEKNGQLVIELLTYIMNIDDEHRTIQELTAIMSEQLARSEHYKRRFIINWTLAFFNGYVFAA